MGLTAGEVMDESALLLNDSAKTTFTFAVQAPWFKRAIDWFSDELAVNSIPLVEQVTTVFTLGPSVTTVVLPADTLIPIKLQEKANFSLEEYTDIHQIDDVSAVTPGKTHNFWAFNGAIAASVPVINVPPADNTRNIRLLYQRMLPKIAGSVGSEDYATSLTFHAKRALGAKTAEYIATFVLKDDKRAKALSGESGLAMHRLIQIWVRRMHPVHRRGYQRF